MASHDLGGRKHGVRPEGLDELGLGDEPPPTSAGAARRCRWPPPQPAQVGGQRAHVGARRAADLDAEDAGLRPASTASRETVTRRAGRPPCRPGPARAAGGRRPARPTPSAAPARCRPRTPTAAAGRPQPDAAHVVRRRDLALVVERARLSAEHDLADVRLAGRVPQQPRHPPEPDQQHARGARVERARVPDPLLAEDAPAAGDDVVRRPPRRLVDDDEARRSPLGAGAHRTSGLGAICAVYAEINLGEVVGQNGRREITSGSGRGCRPGPRGWGGVVEPRRRRWPPPPKRMAMADTSKSVTERSDTASQASPSSTQETSASAVPAHQVDEALGLVDLDAETLEVGVGDPGGDEASARIELGPLQRTRRPAAGRRSGAPRTAGG